MENKQEILDKLLATLQATRIFRDLASLEYEPEQEMVTAIYEGGATLRVNEKSLPGRSRERPK